MLSWDFSETSKNEDFYSSLNMGDITDAGYKHAKKKFGKNLEQKNLGKYHDLSL